MNGDKSNSLTPPPTAEDRLVLRDQTIDEEGPGAILRDFNTLLNFIGQESIPITSKYDLLPMNRLADLNVRLAHPVAEGLEVAADKREEQFISLWDLHI